MKIKRKPIMYGLANVLSSLTGENINCYEYLTTRYKYYNDGIWVNDTNRTYEFRNDDVKIIAITDVFNREIGSDFITEKKYSNMDEYISSNACLFMIKGLSFIFDVDLNCFYQDIINCDATCIDDDNINSIVEKYNTKKEYTKIKK